MKTKKILFIMIILLAAKNLFSQTSDLPKIMYVNATNGLVMRTEPSINSQRISILLFGHRVQVLERSNTTETINGINDYWYRLPYWYYTPPDGRWYNQIWVFGGYLSEELPLDAPVILGRWDDVDNGLYYFYFYPDNRYMEDEMDAHEAAHFGTWALNGNILTLRRKGNYFSEEDIPFETVNAQLEVIDRNNINLNFQDNNRRIRLRRNNNDER